VRQVDYACFLWVQGQPVRSGPLSHHDERCLRSGGRGATDDTVIGVANHVKALGMQSMIQAVEIDIRQQGTDYSAVRGPCQTGFMPPVVMQHARSQKLLNELQDAGVGDAVHTPAQISRRNTPNPHQHAVANHPEHHHHANRSARDHGSVSPPPASSFGSRLAEDSRPKHVRHPAASSCPASCSPHAPRGACSWILVPNKNRCLRWDLHPTGLTCAAAHERDSMGRRGIPHVEVDDCPREIGKRYSRAF